MIWWLITHKNGHIRRSKKNAERTDLQTDGRTCPLNYLIHSLTKRLLRRPIRRISLFKERIDQNQNSISVKQNVWFKVLCSILRLSQPHCKPTCCRSSMTTLGLLFSVSMSVSVSGRPRLVRAPVDAEAEEAALWDRSQRTRSFWDIIHFPTSEGVSEVSERTNERVSAAERASEASRAEPADKYVCEYVFKSVQQCG